MKSEVFVLIDAQGRFWKKKSPNGRRGVYAFTSRQKAEATLNQFCPKPAPGEVKVKRFVLDEAE